MGIQFCGTCGQPLIPDQLFCQHCGSRADEFATRAAPASGSAQMPPGGMLYCGECGAAVSSRDTACRRCGAPLELIRNSFTTREGNDEPIVGGVPPYTQDRQSIAYQQPPSSSPASLAGKPASWASDYGSSARDYPPDDPPTFSTGVSSISRQSHPKGPPSAGAPPSFPNAYVPPRRPRWPLILAVALVALALIVGGSIYLLANQQGTGGQTTRPTATPRGGQSTITPGPTEAALNGPNAQALINQFYTDINSKQLDAAYDLLSTNYQGTQSRENFKSGYQTTVSDTWTLGDTQTLSDGSIQVPITLTAIDNKNGTNVTTTYTGYYIVIKENGQLRIDQGNLTAQPS
ncbi:MAG TPA: zinc ribbon domain-containing protein [Ktedonobacterales bacterium]|nr:zinc ribbon domain-containing protein [Ktedonobacterales bacterium]